MANNDHWRTDPRRGRAEGGYEDWGGRPDEGRFMEEGRHRSREGAGIHRYQGDYRDRPQGRYDDWGGRADHGRFSEEAASGRESGSRRGFGSDDRSGSHGSRYGSSGAPGYPGENRSGGFFGQNRRGRESGYAGSGAADHENGFYGEDRNFGRHDDPGGSRHGSAGYPSGAGPQGERSFWDRATDEVSSWFGGERRSDHRGRGPRNYARSDDRIREDVSDRLTDDPYVDASDIEVTVSHREVTLSGTVESREARRRAEDIAETVSGVTHVQNNLRVGSPSEGVVTPPLGESVTAMNSSDANRISAETAGSTHSRGSRRR